MTIRKTQITNTGLQVSVIGLGCMGMSTPSAPPREECLKLISEALAAGVNLFNTSVHYGWGQNEELLGEAIKMHGRDKFIISGKFGAIKNADGSFGIDGSPANARKSVEESLKRLGTDYIDIYALARVDPKVPIEESVRALAELQKEGKIRHIGLSEVKGDTIRRAHAVAPIATIESEMSLWSLHLREDTLPVMRELGISLLAYSPLGRGFLTGQIKKVDDLPENDFRRHMPRVGENFDHNIKLVDAVERIAKKKDITNSQLALAWLLAQGNDIIPIPGTTKVGRLHENLAAADVKLTKEELDEIESIIGSFEVKGDRYPKQFVSTLQQ